MKTEHQIDAFIRREKETVPNPYLSTRVMTKIEELEQKERRKAPLWQTLALAASIAAIAFLGVSIGNSYVESGTSERILNINDRQIESLGYYHFDEYE
jgi:type VI protein secretion system component VasF